jgi:hypothetical protein
MLHFIGWEQITENFFADVPYAPILYCPYSITYAHIFMQYVTLLHIPLVPFKPLNTLTLTLPNPYP